jgi:hypothetical protein
LKNEGLEEEYFNRNPDTQQKSRKQNEENPKKKIKTKATTSIMSNRICLARN